MNLASLMVHQVLAIYCLYLFIFSDAGFVLNFRRLV